MNLLSVFEGATVFLSVAALVTLSAALIEVFIHRGTPKHPDYVLAILILKYLTIGGWVVVVSLIVNYIWRFYKGLPGSVAQGPLTNSLVSLASLAFSFAFFTLIGAVLIYLLWVSDVPTEEERARRRRVAQRRVEVERIARIRRSSRVIPRGGDK